MILTPHIFFYNDDVEDFEHDEYFITFGEKVSHNYYLESEHFSCSRDELYVTTQMNEHALDLTTLIATIKPIVDDVGVRGKLTFVDTFRGKLVEEVNSSHKLKIIPHGYCDLVERNFGTERRQYIENFVLTGFVMEL